MKSAIGGTLSNIARDHGLSVSVVALAWVRKQPGIRVPIFGASSRTQLQELTRVTSVTLTAKDMATLDVAFSAWRMASFKEKAKTIVMGVLAK
ncbi:MAG: hypothetical protein CMQ05_18295 [Gammaproteobacteria bacterium]|nr:hypothetical protein [Gammaproteobacteria bacterium]RPG23688.1 MAG: aldo/keto reductase [Gammaproteobacteria bacterium TMED50]|tara:strand:+ start:88 stop:366 length:279 start_codon:yes stop_codon:yes gene_type:complete